MHARYSRSGELRKACTKGTSQLVEVDADHFFFEGSGLKPVTCAASPLLDRTDHGLKSSTNHKSFNYYPRETGVPPTTKASLEEYPVESHHSPREVNKIRTRMAILKGRGDAACSELFRP